MNTDYGIRPITGDEMIAAFGSAAAALKATGGDEAVALFYLNNTDRIANAPPSEVTRETWLAAELRRLRDMERDAAKRAEAARKLREREAADDELARAAQAAWSAMEKPSVAGVARSMKLYWHRTKQLLDRKVA